MQGYHCILTQLSGKIQNNIMWDLYVNKGWGNLSIAWMGAKGLLPLIGTLNNTQYIATDVNSCDSYDYALFLFL